MLHITRSVTQKLHESRRKRPRESTTEDAQSKKMKLALQEYLDKRDPNKLASLETEEKLRRTKLAEYCNLSIIHECDCWVGVDLKFEKKFQNNETGVYSSEVGDKMTLLFQKTTSHNFPCAAVFKPSENQITVTNCNGDVATFEIEDHPLMKFPKFPDASLRLLTADPIVDKALMLRTAEGVNLRKFGLRIHVVPTESKTEDFNGFEIIDEQIENQGKLMTPENMLLSVKPIEKTTLRPGGLAAKTLLLKSGCWFVFTNRSKRVTKAYILRRKSCQNETNCTSEFENFQFKVCDCDGRKFEFDYKLLAPNIQKLDVISGTCPEGCLRPEAIADFQS